MRGPRARARARNPPYGAAQPLRVDSRRRKPALVGPFGAPAMRVGRFFGIDVGVDASWIFIFLLITVSLSQMFLSEHADWPASFAWAGAIVASILFFVSILLHEFGHSLTSNALGLPVRSITLFLFGGLASLSGEPERPRDEFLIGAAGPLVSILLGGLFLGMGFLVPAEPALAEVARSIFLWLGTINLILAAFNLFPGFPLDGGHLLRAVLWSSTKDFDRSTRIASAAGALFALALIGVGVLTGLFTGNLFAGLWYVLIGWFILSAARRTSSQVTLEAQLGKSRVGDAMAPLEPALISSVESSESVADVIEGPVLHQGRRYLLVEEEGEPVGMVTLEDIKRVPLGARGSTPVASIMVPRSELVTTTPDSTLLDAMKRMEEAGVSQLPVVEDGRLAGVLSRDQLLGVLRARMELRSA